MTSRIKVSKAQLRAMTVLWAYDVLKLIAGFDIMNAYGINPWVFFVLDVVTVPGYIVGWMCLLASLPGRLPLKSLLFWSAVTFLCSTAPYFYAAWAGSQAFPLKAWIILGVIMGFPLISSIRTLRQTFRNRQESRPPASRTPKPFYN